MSLVRDAERQMRADIRKVAEQKRKRVSELDFFILDDSICERRFGELRRTVENKKTTYQLVKACGIDNIIVASFSQLPRSDDAFCQWLKEQGEDFNKLFSFSEVCGGRIIDGAYDMETIPTALRKNCKYGIYNTFFEVDLADDNVEWGTRFTVHDMCNLIEKWMNWVYDNINKKARILLNFRDLPIAMRQYPERLLSVVRFLSEMPFEKRMFGLAFEDMVGESIPEELGVWTAAVRKVMDGCGWQSGKLLVHIHQKWDLQMAATLSCLDAGADGVWAGICEEGAAMGHASSTVTLMNLVRLGNERVLEMYDCKKFREAAIEITKLTTGKSPHKNLAVYGERALDPALCFQGFATGEFFGTNETRSFTTLVTPQVILESLVMLFGENPNFTTEIAKKMNETMQEDINSVPPRKEEYVSEMGLALLFNRSGGPLTEKMRQAIAKVEANQQRHKDIVEEIKRLWDEAQEGSRLNFDTFYHGIIVPYLGVLYHCKSTKKALRGLDLCTDGYVDWEDFKVYIKWALHRYPEVATADETLEIAFQQGVLPALHDANHAELHHLDENSEN